jgi:D-serine deaminase-like pyridoxal phosphate-dependent protein
LSAAREDLVEPLLGQVLIEIGVDLHRRGALADADALHDEKRKTTVLGGPSGHEPVLPFEHFLQLFRAEDHAGDVGAELDQVAAHLSVAIEVIESGRAPDQRGRKVQSLGQ